MDTSSAIDRSLSGFDSQLKQIVSRYSQQVERLMLQNLSKEGRIITFGDANYNYVAQSYEGLKDLLYRSGYGDLAREFVDRESDLLRDYTRLRPSGAVPIQITQRFTEQLDTLRRIELFQFDALADTAVRAVQGAVMQGVLTGTNTMVLADQISGSIEAPLQRYAWTYVNTARANFIQAVEDANVDKANQDEIYWEYVGPEDDLNREACIEGLSQRYFTDSEREQFEAETADERLYNCRHTFMEITKEAYESGS